MYFCKVGNIGRRHKKLLLCGYPVKPICRDMIMLRKIEVYDITHHDLHSACNLFLHDTVYDGKSHV